MSNKNDRDRELDNFLKPLRGQTPDDLQMQRWLSAALKEDKKTNVKWNFVLQLAAAMFVGIIIGASLNFHSQNNSLEKSVADATFEHSYANLN